MPYETQFIEKKTVKGPVAILSFCFLIFGLALGYFFRPKIEFNSKFFTSPFISDNSKKLPLNQYTINNLSQREFQVSPLILEKIISKEPRYTSYIFSYHTLGKRMTGQANIPNNLSVLNPPSLIILIRGYVPLENYETGVGTKNAAAFLAENGYITLSPDFFGFGGSDGESEDSWEARFVKPINVIELIKSVESGEWQVAESLSTLQPNNSTPTLRTPLPTIKVGLWAHSNGGQIALTSLEILGEAIPATLWAPVTAPFPYSILFFSDEAQDEGKEMRKYGILFETEYNAFDFSLSKHLNKLNSPLQIHHGTNDEAALQSWSLEFTDKLAAENERRSLSPEVERTSGEDEASQISEVKPIDYELFSYPGADHNLQPENNWNQAIQRDLTFLSKHLQ